MFGRLIVLSALAACVTTVWYNYAPPSQRAQVPAPIKSVVEIVDEKFAAGMMASQRWLAHHQMTTAGDVPSPISVGGPIQTTNETSVTPSLEDQNYFVARNLSNTVWADKDLSNARFDGASMRNVSFAGTSIAGASARLVDAAHGVFHLTNAPKVAFDGSTLNGAFFIDATVDEGSFIEAKMKALTFRGGSFIQTQFDGANLNASSFVGSDLRRASFVRADLRHTTFRGTPLHGADFTGAYLSGSDLRETSGLTDRMLRHACGDATTRLPPGVSIPQCSGPEQTHLAQMSPTRATEQISARH